MTILNLKWQSTCMDGVLLEPNSDFRNDLSDWENKINGIPDSSNDLSSDEQIEFLSSTRDLESLYKYL